MGSVYLREQDRVYCKSSPVTNLQEQIGEMEAVPNLRARILFQLLHKVPFVTCQSVVFIVLRALLFLCN